MIRINNTQYFHFLQQADILRRSGSLCDAIISVRSQTFRAHRLVLACASKSLAQQLSRGDIDSPVHCTLEYFSPHTFQQVLDFTYTQTLEVSIDDLHLLLRAAQMLEMQLLEEQCRKQLDNLHYRAREERKSREVSQVKEERESTEQTDKRREEKVKDASPSEDQACSSSVTASSSASDKVEVDSSTPPPVKKPRLPPVSVATSSRESVIASSNDGSSLPPWILHPNVWNSVNTLRWMAENYSNLVDTHPLQSQNESSAGHTFPLSTPHMFYLGRHFPSSVMGYPTLHPRYSHNLHAGSTGMQNIIKQGLWKRKRSSQTAVTRNGQSGEPSYQDVPKASAARLKDCQHCRARLDGEPRDSASTPSGEARAGCRFCGRGEAAQNESYSRRQDHTGEKPYQCQYCTKKFSLKHQLDTHHRVHTGEKPFECRICGQRSRDYSAMIKHLRTHGGAAPYQCTVCREFCNSLVAMQRHVKSHSVQDFPPNWSINSTYLYTSDL